MAATFTYRRGDELPGLTLPWQYESAQNVWDDLDLSSGYTFAASLTSRSGTAVSVDATVSGYDGGVTVTWAADDLDIVPGVYTLTVTATEAATSKARTYNSANRPTIEIV